MPKKSDKESSAKPVKKNTSVKKTDVKKTTRSKKTSSLDNLDQLADDKTQTWNDKNDEESLEKSDDEDDSTSHSDSNDKSNDITDDTNDTCDESVDNVKSSRKTVDHKTADHKTVDHKTVDHKTVDHKTADHKTVDHKTADHQATDHKTADYKVTDNTVVPKTNYQGNKDNTPKEQSFLRGRVYLDRQDSTRNNNQTNNHYNAQYNNQPNNRYNNQPNSQYGNKPFSQNETASVYTAQSVAKFVQSDYLKSIVQLKDASVTDLLRTAIAKSRDMGQKHLTDVLTQTLKATNMECEFPTITEMQWRHTQKKKHPYDNRDKNPRYRDD
jgi:hypothetical protein